MKTLYYVPLEKLDERYTISLDRMIKDEFKKRNINYQVVEGKTLSDRIVSGAFLDFAGTNYFKSTQIQKIAEMFFNKDVCEGDVFFFADAWMPGIDAVPYMARLSGVSVKMSGILYAGSWTWSDFVAVNLRDYARYIERGWFEFFDEIYFISNFIKQEYVDNLTGRTPTKDEIDRKLKVTLLPFDSDYVRQFYDLEPEHRDKIVIFPHRFHWEKGADTFLDMATVISKIDPDVKFVITSGRLGDIPLADTNEILNQYRLVKEQLGDRLIYKSGLSKQDFYRELTKARVVWSSALQENYGYSVLESCTLGVTPILPNRVVYPEFYDNKYLYNRLEEGYNMVIHYLNYPDPIPYAKLAAKNGLTNIVDNLERLLS